MRAHLILAAIFAIALVAYAPSFTASFQYDDFDQIVYNSALETPALRPLVVWARSRIIPFATLALNRLIGGENPLGYHAVNFAIHLLAVFFVFRLADALCSTPRLRDTSLTRHRLALAAAAAALFACHPIQVQAVTYVVQRITSLAAMFYIGAVYFYVVARNSGDAPPRARRRAAFLAAAGMGLGAFLSKENSASLPLAILLTEWTFYGGAGGRRVLARSWPFLVLLLVIPALWLAVPTRVWRFAPAADHDLPTMTDMLVRTADPSGRLTPTTYFLTQCTVIPRYLRLILWPSGQNIDHDVPFAAGLSAAVVAGFALLATLFAAGVWAARRRPLAGFGVLWFFTALSVESSFLPISDVMVEHRLYLPMAGVALAAAGAFAEVRQRQPRAALAAGLAVVLALSAATFTRNRVWRTQLSLWTDALAKSPDKSRVHANIGTALHLEGKLDEAIPYYCRALKLDPENERAQYHLNLVVEARIEQGTAPVEVEQGEDGTPIFVVRDPCTR